MSTWRHIIAAGLAPVVVATVALATVAPPGKPAGAAPPPAAHATVVNPNPSDTTAHVLDGRTEAVLDLGSRVLVGGTFTQVKRYNQPAKFSRSYLFAYDKATGAIDTRFAPQPNGRVSALLLAPDGQVLVSGQFTSIGGRPIPYLAKLDPVTGAVNTSFTPTPDGMVYDMHLARGHLYVGGTFTRVRGVTRTNFAVVDPASGAPRGGPDMAFTAGPGTTRLMRFDITPDGRKLVGIGNFARVGGQSRPNAVVLDLTPAGGATVSGWSTDQFRYRVCGGSWDTITYDVDLSPDGTYFVIVTTGGPGGTSRLCDTATRWETDRTGVAQPTWRNDTGGDSLTSVAVTGAAVYVAGHQRWADNPQGHDSKGPGAVDRVGIAALDPRTGKALSWNPGRERGFVTPRLVATPQGLYVLSDTAGFAGEFHPRLTYLSLAGDTPAGPRPSAPGTPSVTGATAGSAALAWTAPSSAGTSGVTGYRVTVRADAAGTAVRTLDVGPGRTATVTGLTPGRLHRFSVAARNASGMGPESASSAHALPPFRTVDAFTDRQFRDFAGRAPTTAELSSWRTRLGDGTATPKALVSSLVDVSYASPTIAPITRLYSAYFLRLPDTTGLDHWVGQSRRGTTLRTMSRHFAASDEFRRLYGALGDADFVRLVYRNVLDRQPDNRGLDFWVGELRKGASRGSIMVGFSESAEYRADTRAEAEIVTIVRSMLSRVPSGPERATWEPRLESGTARAELIAWVLAQPAYDARV